MREISVEPVDEYGRVKSAEECFIEAFEKVGGHTKASTPTQQVFDLAVSSVSSKNTYIAPAEAIKRASARLFENDETSPSVLARVLDARYPEWADWEPETIWRTIGSELSQVPTEAVKNKIMAIQNIKSGGDFFREWHVFEKAVLSLNGVIPNFTVIEIPSPGQMAFAVVESEKIRKDTFSDEVIGYIRSVMQMAGFLVYPKELAFAATTRAIERMAEIKEKWREIAGKFNDEIPETIEGIQLGRLAAVEKYVEDKMKAGVGIDK